MLVTPLHVMNSRETKSGAHTWQRDCAHARLVTRDGNYGKCYPVARILYVRI